MYNFIDHTKIGVYNHIHSSDNDKVEVIRHILFFASGQKITIGKLKEYFTEEAIIKFIGDGYIKEII